MSFLSADLDVLFTELEVEGVGDVEGPGVGTLSSSMAGPSAKVAASCPQASAMEACMQTMVLVWYLKDERDEDGGRIQKDTLTCL